ncbi:MAG: 4-hydroxy-tetrahydrodipicolinate synthase [SAR202 cluster bacterium]|nr:4-hydroxy-tetrahydrodipicolinate synthase [SAR202 cluster bacterium]
MRTPGRLITAMVTPFTDDGELDYAQAKRLANALVDSGSEGLVVTGTTGENPSLMHDENVRLWSAVKEAVGDRATVIAGSGTNGTRETIELSKQAERAGADALLLVVPYYNKPTQEGIYRHMKAVAESVALPVIPYNVPSRTIVNMSVETTLRVAEIPNVIGVKEASGDFEQIGSIIAQVPKGFLVWSGNDSDTFGVMSMGGYGIISVASHLIGKQIKRMIDYLVAGEMEKAAAEHLRQLPLAKGLFVIANPIPVKYCLNKAGFRVGPTRLPLCEPDAKTAAFLDNLLARYTVDLPTTVAAG